LKFTGSTFHSREKGVLAYRGAINSLEEIAPASIHKYFWMDGRFCVSSTRHVQGDHSFIQSMCMLSSCNEPADGQPSRMYTSTFGDIVISFITTGDSIIKNDPKRVMITRRSKNDSDTKNDETDLANLIKNLLVVEKSDITDEALEWMNNILSMFGVRQTSSIKKKAPSHPKPSPVSYATKASASLVTAPSTMVDLSSLSREDLLAALAAQELAEAEKKAMETKKIEDDRRNALSFFSNITDKSFLTDALSSLSLEMASNALEILPNIVSSMKAALQEEKNRILNDIKEGLSPPLNNVLSSADAPAYHASIAAEKAAKAAASAAKASQVAADSKKKATQLRAHANSLHPKDSHKSAAEKLASREENNAKALKIQANIATAAAKKAKDIANKASSDLSAPPGLSATLPATLPASAILPTSATLKPKIGGTFSSLSVEVDSDKEEETLSRPASRSSTRSWQEVEEQQEAEEAEEAAAAAAALAKNM